MWLMFAVKLVKKILRVRNYMNISKGRIPVNRLIKSQFLYCALFWKFNSSTWHNRINRTLEKALSLVYYSKICSVKVNRFFQNTLLWLLLGILNYEIHLIKKLDWKGWFGQTDLLFVPTLPLWEGSSCPLGPPSRFEVILA